MNQVFEASAIPNIGYYFDFSCFNLIFTIIEKAYSALKSSYLIYYQVVSKFTRTCFCVTVQFFSRRQRALDYHRIHTRGPAL